MHNDIPDSYLVSQLDLVVPPSRVESLSSEVLLAPQLWEGGLVQHPSGVDQHLRVVLRPPGGEGPPPALLLQPLCLHYGGVEGDVRQNAKLNCSLFQVRLTTKN